MGREKTHKNCKETHVTKHVSTTTVTATTRDKTKHTDSSYMSHPIEAAHSHPTSLGQDEMHPEPSSCRAPQSHRSTQYPRSTSSQGSPQRTCWQSSSSWPLTQHDWSDSAGRGEGRNGGGGRGGEGVGRGRVIEGEECGCWLATATHVCKVHLLTVIT